MNRKQKSEVRSQEMKKPAKTFQDLVVWQKAHEFALMTYKFTANFPKEEIYGLSSQFRRAAVSIPANIAEGFKKAGKKDKIRFYNISQGSLEECRYYIILSEDLGYGIGDEMENLLEEISKLISSYIKSISANYE
jgi:four helix bundle protein